MGGDVERDGRSNITLTFPAASEFLALARAVASQLAARAGLSLDQLDDARLAVDEAVAQVLNAAAPGAQITCAFSVDELGLHLAVSAPSDRPEPPSRATFAWTVLSALADEAEASVHQGVLEISLLLRRAIVEA